MKQEFGRCYACPRGVEHRNWLMKLIEGGNPIPDPNCPGPEDLVTDTIVGIGFRNAQVGINILKETICYRDVTPTRRRASEVAEQIAINRFTKALGEIHDGRKKLPGN